MCALQKNKYFGTFHRINQHEFSVLWLSEMRPAAAAVELSIGLSKDISFKILEDFHNQQCPEKAPYHGLLFVESAHQHFHSYKYYKK